MESESHGAAPVHSPAKQGSLTDKEQHSVTKKKRTITRRMKLCIALHVFFAIITLGLMLLFIIGRSISQHSIDQSEVEITSMGLSANCEDAKANQRIACVSFGFMMSGMPSSMEAYKPRMLNSHGTLDFESLEVGRLRLPDIEISDSGSGIGKRNQPPVIHVNATLEITNTEHFTRFAHAIMSKPRFSVGLNVVTEISVNLFGNFVVIFSNIILDKQLDLAGMNNLPNMSVLDFNLVYAYQDRMTKNKFLEISSQIECHNPSVISIHDIGHLVFDIYGQGLLLGKTVLYNASIVGGINRFSNLTVFVSERESEKILENSLMVPFIYGEFRLGGVFNFHAHS
jgi:hypothetical protein